MAGRAVVGKPSGMQHGVEMEHVEPEVVGAASADIFQRGGLRMRGREASRDVGLEEDEEEEDLGVTQEPPTPEEQRWGLWLAIVSAVDVVLSGAIFIASFSFAWRAAGVSLWCMGIQAISHLLSSLMLTMRFLGERSFHIASTDELTRSGLLRKDRRRFLVREQITAIIMGLVMLLSSAGLLFKAFTKIKFWKTWYDDHETKDRETQLALEFLAWNGFSIYFIQAVFRLIAARKIRRVIVWHTFVASVVSLIFLFVLGFAASYQKEWSWKAEPIAAIALAFVTLGEGIRIVVMHLDDMDTRLRFDPRA